MHRHPPIADSVPVLTPANYPSFSRRQSRLGVGLPSTIRPTPPTLPDFATELSFHVQPRNGMHTTTVQPAPSSPAQQGLLCIPVALGNTGMVGCQALLPSLLSLAKVHRRLMFRCSGMLLPRAPMISSTFLTKLQGFLLIGTARFEMPLNTSRGS